MLVSTSPGAERGADNYCVTDSLICDSGVTRDPAGGLWANMVPELGTRGGMGAMGPVARLAS